VICPGAVVGAGQMGGTVDRSRLYGYLQMR
jgi:hypothetical protein